MSLARACWISAALLGALGSASCLVDYGKYEYIPSVCGNSVVEYGEECDEAGVLSTTCTPSCNVPRCGDGYLSPELGEGCDDGNLKDGDSCSKACQPVPFTLQANVGLASATFQLNPSIGLSMVDGVPHFVVAWVQVPDGGGKRRIVKRTYLLNGNPVEDAPVALSNSPNDATCTATASNAAGRSMVVWDESPGTSAEIHYTVIEPTGEIGSAGAQLLTGSTVGVYQGCPAVAATDTGEFCMLWQGSDNNEHVDCFDPTGAHAGTSQTLTGAIASGSSRQWGARAIWGVNGGFVSSWFDGFQQPDQNHYLDGAQLDATGLAVGNAAVFSQLFYDYDGNGFALGASGGFVTSYGMRGMFGQTETKTRFLMSRYDSYDQPAVQQDQLVSDTHTDEFGGRLIPHRPSGRFLAAWSALSGSGCDVLHRKFDATGAPVGAANSVGLNPANECGERIAGVATDAGDVMMVWTWRKADSSGSANLQGIIIPGMLAQ